MGLFDIFKNKQSLYIPRNDYTKEHGCIDMFKFDRYSARKWNNIIIHHSATVDGNTYDWDAISKFHVKERGWAQIGYHWGIELVNGVYKYCLGRGLHNKGAHCKDGNMNDTSIGICLVGNFDLVEPNKQQYFLLASLCRNLMNEFEIPKEHIYPHRKFNIKKSCPGKLFSLEKLYKTIG